MTDDPLIPYEGDKIVAEVIELADIRIRWGRSKTPNSEQCRHHALVYSQTERRVWCEDCGRTIDNFDAFMVIVNNFGRMVAEARVRLDKANEAMTATVRRRAAKEFDRLWSGSMVPGCPHCHRGLLPEDFSDGAGMALGRDYEIARRNRDKTE